MIVRHIPCSPYVNQSEREATESLKIRLTNQPGKGLWVLLSNYYHSTGAQYMSDEIDLVVAGPPGVFIVEIKHWSGVDLKRNFQEIAKGEADRLMAKARRVAGRLRRACDFNFGFVTGKLLVTKNENDRFKEELSRKSICGVEVYGLKEWSDLLEVQVAPLLTNDQVEAIWRALQPASPQNNVGGLRVFENFFDLEEASGPQESFHRVFRGRRKQYRDRVILHLYDLTAINHKDAIEIAEREFKTLQAFQKSPWLPSIIDSFQPAKSYPGELYFFSYFDTEAPTLADRANDQKWSIDERLYTAQQCISALQSLHTGLSGEQNPALHRNLTPVSVRVRSNGEPLLTQLHAVRLAGSATIAGAIKIDLGDGARYFAPEVRQGGLMNCTPASDVYSLCATLRLIFESAADSPRARAALEILERGTAELPEMRPTLERISQDFELIKNERAPQTQPRLPAKYWDETTEGIELNNNHYRILTRLGSGGFGITFKVMQIDPHTGEEVAGPFVAKVINNEEAGEDAALNYKRVRAQTHTPHLAGILEVISEWQPDRITALLKWVDGFSLDELTGVLPLYFDELEEKEHEETLINWLIYLCDGLTSMHESGLVHGDISPRNVIVDGYTVTITDFDLSGRVGEEVQGGTEPFCSPEISRTLSASSDVPAHCRQLSDDLYALGATIFHVLFDRHPFDHSTGNADVTLIDKKRGLAWREAERGEWPRVAQFLDRATHPDPAQRFRSAMEALEFLEALSATGEAEIPTEVEYTTEREAAPILAENRAPWLSQLLQSYPGSTKGNAETRGLDSDFAQQTYVETQLDEIIAKEIRSQQVSLVILCGNAGDGKTAFLQNLASRLGLNVGPSAVRLWDYALEDGLRVRANLDGSASYQGRSAKELLDSFFEPFHDGAFPPDLAHLIAINDGPLLAWLNESPDNFLTRQLRAALSSDNGVILDSRIRFVNLNARSLVGGIRAGSADIPTGFLDELLSKMLGDGRPDVWRPCRTCSAQARCPAWNSAQMLQDSNTGPLIKERLTRALQAVHQRGEIHITARSLRAALVYIFFGTCDCEELHQNPSLPKQRDTYYNRAFNAESLNRQGDLLAELQKLDPALESHPRIDRHLLLYEDQDSQTYGDDSQDSPHLPSLRRRAWFEWPDEKIRRVADNVSSLTLARGSYLDEFLKVGVGSDEERQGICSDLCAGLARLEDLPDEARNRPDSVPLKITPRTPTETAFWVSKPRDRFSLRAVIPQVTEGIEALHTHLELSYRYESGGYERLLINAELFHLLMELKDGYQISDAQSDDIFANLSIFKQRIAQENDHTIFAWSTQDECVFKIRVEQAAGVQKLVVTEEKDRR